MEPRKLYRSSSNKKISGVCGGIGNYFNVDANLIRILLVVLAIFSNVGVGLILVAYIVAAVILPEDGV